MGQLERLFTHDLSAQIAALPRKQQAVRLPRRIHVEWGTYHYSAVFQADRSEAAELRTLLDEARFHLGKDWGGGIYADRYMYDIAVLTSGAVVRLQPPGDDAQLYHVGNALGNARSKSIHSPLGAAQDLSALQRASLFKVFDAIRADEGIERSHIVDHCEWPRGTSAPAVRTLFYAPQPGQSSCPGPILHQHILAYRALGAAQVPTAPLPSLTYGTWLRGQGDGVVRYRYKVPRGQTATIRTSMERKPDNVFAELGAGDIFGVDCVVYGETVSGSHDWLHAANGRGFVHSSGVVLQ